MLASRHLLHDIFQRLSSQFVQMCTSRPGRRASSRTPPSPAPDAQKPSRQQFGVSREKKARGVSKITWHVTAPSSPYQPHNRAVPSYRLAQTWLPNILCEQVERTVGNDNCVHFESLPSLSRAAWSRRKSLPSSWETQLEWWKWGLAAPAASRWII